MGKCECPTKRLPMIIPLLSPEQVAEILGIAVRRVHELVRRREVRCVQISPKDRRFTQEQIDEYITRRSTPESPKQVDRKSADKLPFAPKGGDYRKSTGDSLSERKKMKEELRSWQ